MNLKTARKRNICLRFFCHYGGFGFISDTDGREVFFHQSSLVGITFDALKGDENIEFDVEKSDKGPRAVNVRIVK